MQNIPLSASPNHNSCAGMHSYMQCACELAYRAGLPTRVCSRIGPGTVPLVALYSSSAPQSCQNAKCRSMCHPQHRPWGRRFHLASGEVGVWACTVRVLVGVEHSTRICIKHVACNSEDSNLQKQSWPLTLPDVVSRLSDHAGSAQQRAAPVQVLVTVEKNNC